MFRRSIIGGALLAATAGLTTNIPERIFGGANDPQAKTADAIVIFTGSENRIRTGLEIAEGGKLQKIFISGADNASTLDEMLANLDLTRADLRAPPENIIFGRRALTTAGNGMETGAWLRRNPQIKSIALVTSREHMWRAETELRRHLPPGVKVYFHSFDGAEFNPVTEAGEHLKQICARIEPLRDWCSLNQEQGNLTPG